MVDVRTQAPTGHSILPPKDDWPAQAADTIERVVGTVREKATGPALKAGRAVVYGTFAGIVGLAALVIVVIAMVRFVDVWLPGGVWAAHLLVGVIFCVAGAFAWSQRTAKEDA